MESVIQGLTIVTGIVGFAGYVWIVVAAFSNDDAAWGLGCVFCWPAAIAYAILNFDDLYVPLLILIIAVLAEIGLFSASAFLA